MQSQNQKLNDSLQSIKAGQNLQSERASLLSMDRSKTQIQPLRRDLSIIEEAEGAYSQYNLT